MDLNGAGLPCQAKKYRLYSTSKSTGYKAVSSTAWCFFTDTLRTDGKEGTRGEEASDEAMAIVHMEKWLGNLQWKGEKRI